MTTAEIGKEVGRRWGLLSDDEKAKYKERCEKINAEAGECLLLSRQMAVPRP